MTKVTKLKNVAFHYIICNTSSILPKASKKRVQEVDDNMVRAVEFSNRVDDVMAVYKSIFIQKKKQRSQLPITVFLVCLKPEERPPAATTPTSATPTPPPAAFPVSPAASSEEQ